MLLEPLYDSYLPMIERAGGVPMLVRLEPPDWRLPRRALEAAFSKETKLLVLNTPMNPPGKVFDEPDLAFLAGCWRTATPMPSATRSTSTWCSTSGATGR